MPSVATYVVEPTIKVDGATLAVTLYDELADLRIEQSLDLPDRATISFHDPDLSLAEGGTFAIGKGITVTMKASGGETAELMDGEIVGVSVDSGPGGIFVLVVTALARTHRLARSVKVRTFTEKSDADIVRQIGSEQGLSVVTDAPSDPRPYVLQAESDHAMLTRLALATSSRWWIEGSRLNFKKVAAPDDGLTYERAQLNSLSMRLSSVDAAGAVTVRGWSARDQQSVVASATPGNALGDGYGANAAAATEVTGKAAQFDSGKRFTTSALSDQSSAQAVADSLGRRTASAHARVRGVVVGHPELRPGTTIELKGLGRSFSGKYAVTAVDHVLSADTGYVSRFKCQGIGASELVDLLRPPPRRDPMTGLMIGVVTALNDPDGLGRVKVKFPTLSDDDESAWARLVLPGAGPSRGFQVMPEINDEVLVGFEQGDPACPVVLGGLWSAKNTPPLATDDAVKSNAVAQRVWHTRKGHVIEIKDEDGAHEILVSLAGDKGSIKLTDDAIAITSKGDISITAEGGIKLTATNDISLEGQNITAKAKSKVAVEGVEVGIKGSAKAAMQAPNTEVKGDAKVAVSAGGMAEIKGGMVKLN